MHIPTTSHMSSKTKSGLRLLLSGGGFTKVRQVVVGSGTVVCGVGRDRSPSHAGDAEEALPWAWSDRPGTRQDDLTQTGSKSSIVRGSKKGAPYLKGEDKVAD